jgi:leader peptidase (prepilin peptidase) / N-methyltransferase
MGRKSLPAKERALDAFYYLSTFLFGLVFGSFGNVVIWRLPRGESLSVPASHCPVCETPIAWYDNVPLVSWLVLLGRCRSCATPISIRYPVVELLSGLLWMAAAVRFGFTAQAAVAIVFFYVLLLLAFIDIDTMRLPNSLVGLLAFLALVGLVASQVTGIPLAPLVATGTGLLASPLVFGSAGALVSAGSVLLIALVYTRIRGIQGFGMGDIKLLAVIGLFLGPYGLLVLGIGSMIGAVYGIAASRKSADGMRHKFPFGPFLAFAAVVVTLLGEPLVAWYARVMLGAL